MNLHPEPARSLPIVVATDVLVAGGGPAGIAAAYAAAQAGARVHLIETHGQLGGIWTTGLLGWILDDANKPGVMRLLLDRLAQAGARQEKRSGGTAVDPEILKLILEEMLLEVGVTIRLHTRVVAAARNANNRLSVVVTESKSGREAWSAQTFIDCTGDGDLGWQAGCGFDFGRESDRAFQPMSLIAILCGVEFEAIKAFVHNAPHTNYRDSTRNLVALLAEAGHECSYAQPIIMKIHDNLFAIMANHEYQQSGLDAQALTTATLHARKEIHHIVALLRNSGGPWTNIRLAATGAQIGVREGRRIHGRATVGDQDLATGARQPDAICRCTFGVDVHAPDPSKGKGYDHGTIKAQPYDIPLRALIARDCDGLLMAGRCISGSFTAHSSYRVTGDAVAMGQAAGVCAALSVQQGCLPHEVPFAAVRAELDTLNGTHPAMNAEATHGSSVKRNTW